MRYITITIWALLCLSTAFAQNGKYEVRLSEFLVDDVNLHYHVDIEIKSASINDTFNISHQSYRFTFDPAVLENPIIDQELDLSGTIDDSFFGGHYINGSKDSIISYNVELGSPTPYPLPHDQWTSVGRLRFDILDLQGDPNFSWKSSTDFPATVILTKEGNDFPQVYDGDYIGNTCFASCVHAGEDQAFCQDVPNFQLEGAGDGSWSNFGPMNLSDINSPTPTVTNLTPGIWEFVYTVDNLDDTIQITIADDCVFPGDTNNDTEVNNFDILNIGIGAGQTGNPRLNPSIDWIGQFADDWTATTPISNTNLKHADTDGNGSVEAMDTAAIVNNWGESYVNFQKASGTVPFFVNPAIASPGETIDLPIILGDANVPLTDVYGLAFTMTYDTAMVKPETTTAIFADSWFGMLNNDMIEVQRNFSDQGQIDIGLTRMDGQNISGFGEIGILRITIKDDVWLGLLKDEKYLAIGIENVRLQSFSETETLTDPQVSYVIIPEPVTSATTDLDFEMPSLRPNPASEQLTINGLGAVDVVTIYNTLGQVVFQKEAGVKQLLVETADWANGVYLVMMEVEGERFGTRLVVQH